MKEMVVDGKSMVTEPVTSPEPTTESVGRRSMESTQLVTGHGFRRGRQRGSQGCSHKPRKNTLCLHAQHTGRPGRSGPGLQIKDSCWCWDERNGAVSNCSNPIVPLYVTAEESFLFHFVLPGPNLEIPVGSGPTRAIADGLFWFPP
jgi:hypothetical protein